MCVCHRFSYLVSQKRTLGEISKVVASADYAYGASGFPAWGIMPNSELIFEIEVLKYSFTAN